MICSKCLQDKTELEFGIKNQTLGYLNKTCKQCMREYSRKHYQNNKEIHKNKAKKWADKLNPIKDAMLLELKSKPCLDCKQCFPPCAMDFDHLPGTKKKFSIGNKKRDCNLETLKAELEKCELVCANCHRIRTFNRLNK